MENQVANATQAAVETGSMLGWFDPIDMAALAILLFSALLALFRGFTREFFQVVNVVTGLAVAAFALPYALPYAEQVMPAGWIAKTVSSLVIFILVSGAMALLSGYLAKAVRKSSLSTLDRSLGFAFGLARGAFIICLAYILMVLIAKDPAEVEDMAQKAKSGNLIILGANTLIQLLPEQTVAALGLDEALAPAREQAGPRPVLTEERPVAPQDKQAKPAPSASDGAKPSETEPTAKDAPASERTPRDILNDGYDKLERKAIETLIDRNH